MPSGKREAYTPFQHVYAEAGDVVQWQSTCLCAEDENDRALFWFFVCMLHWALPVLHRTSTTELHAPSVYILKGFRFVAWVP